MMPATDHANEGDIIPHFWDWLAPSAGGFGRSSHDLTTSFEIFHNVTLRLYLRGGGQTECESRGGRLDQFVLFRRRHMAISSESQGLPYRESRAQAMIRLPELGPLERGDWLRLAGLGPGREETFWSL
jgi:hypothetical protein